MTSSPAATLRRAAFILFVLLASGICLHAQYNTPNVDGIIEAGEYGNTNNGTNQIATSTGQTWYMTWDATNLYVGIANANLSEGRGHLYRCEPSEPAQWRH